MHLLYVDMDGKLLARILTLLRSKYVCNEAEFSAQIVHDALSTTLDIRWERPYTQFV